MTLNLNIDALAGPGRPKTPLYLEGVHDLGEADLALLGTGVKGVTSDPLKRITDRHHGLARLLAGGVGESEAAATIGYSLSRVSILKQSPAFINLLALYRQEVDREFATVLDHMAGMSKDALLELRSRIEDEPGKFSNRELLDTVTNFVDRADVGEGTAKLPTTIELVAQAPIADHLVTPVATTDEAEGTNGDPIVATPSVTSVSQEASGGDAEGDTRLTDNASEPPALGAAK